MKTEQSPLEKIRARKEKLRVSAKMQENKIGNNFKYIQNHGGKLVLNSIKSAVFPSRNENNIQSKPSSLPLTLTDLALGGVSSVMKGNKGLLPMIWNFAQPFVLTWGIKGAKKLIGGIFSRKKKKKK